jgi:hypothetical protein
VLVVYAEGLIPFIGLSASLLDQYPPKLSTFYIPLSSTLISFSMVHDFSEREEAILASLTGSGGGLFLTKLLFFGPKIGTGAP